MLKRTVVFENPGYLSVKDGQLRYRRAGFEDESAVLAVEDLGVVILEHQGLTITAGLLRVLGANGTAVVVCDESHHPCALMQNLVGNSVHTEVLRAQMYANRPMCKRLWMQIVRAKLRNQAALLAMRAHPGATRLNVLAKEVKSGDSTNREAVGSQVYWPALFDGFRRDRDGEPPNGWLNYGYAILRAACARALVSSGLHCAIGLHHSNRYNPFCLVDDFMEPYRPFVDRAVCELCDRRDRTDALDREAKASLLGVLSSDVHLGKERSPLSVALSRSSASLVRALKGESERLKYPSMK